MSLKFYKFCIAPQTLQMLCFTDSGSYAGCRLSRKINQVNIIITPVSSSVMILISVQLSKQLLPWSVCVCLPTSSDASLTLVKAVQISDQFSCLDYTSLCPAQVQHRYWAETFTSFIQVSASPDPKGSVSIRALIIWPLCHLAFDWSYERNKDLIRSMNFSSPALQKQ